MLFSLSFQNCISQSFFLRILFGKYSQHFTRHVTALFKNGWSLHLTFPHTKKFAWNSWNFITNKAHVPSDVNTVQHCRSTFGLVFRTQNLVSSGVFCKLSAGCHVPLYHTVQRSDCVNIGRHFSRKDTETNITTQLRAFFFLFQTSSTDGGRRCLQPWILQKYLYLFSAWCIFYSTA